ncbi:nitroreductase family protein [Gemmatimonas sp.]|uniref:nitroreductase family protein n=1 Tax=Gemmatimonas sp. TaxID=1962908 RepID=UPI00286C23DF|nr:nitroreductase family protein [Gemmatimonas sp.]
MLTSEATTSALRTAAYATPPERLSAADAAMARHSVRSYLDVPITDDEIHTLLELTGRAPSAFNLQPWRFVVVRDQEVKNALKDAAYGQKQVGEAPVVIAMYSDMDDTMANLGDIVHPDLTPDKRASTIAMLEKNFGGMTPEALAAWGNGQANIALGYLLLIATSEGFDTSPMLGFQPDQVKAILDIPASATMTAMVALGRGADDGFRSHRHAIERTTSFR